MIGEDIVEIEIAVIEVEETTIAVVEDGDTTGTDTMIVVVGT